jgi:hypothetical protein
MALEVGRPLFSALHGSATGQLFYFTFDVMVAAGKDVMALPLDARREILRSQVLSKLADPIRESPELEASLPILIQSVKAQGLGGWLPSAGTAGTRRANALEPGARQGHRPSGRQTATRPERPP